MTDNTKKYQIISLLKTYNLDYIVNFPTRINAYTETTIDNIFLDRRKMSTLILNRTITDYLTTMLKYLHSISPHIILFNLDWQELVGSTMTPL